MMSEKSLDTILIAASLGTHFSLLGVSKIKTYGRYKRKARTTNKLIVATKMNSLM